MTASDFIFLFMVIGLPLLVSIRLFRKEPSHRKFYETCALAVLGTNLIFIPIAVILAVSGIGGIGMFDGIFATIAAIPIAPVVGLFIRAHRRKEATLNS